MNSHTVKVRFFAQLREEVGQDSELCSLESGDTGLSLYLRLKDKYDFTLHHDELRLAVNDAFAPMATKLEAGDKVAFIPPVAGG